MKVSESWLREWVNPALKGQDLANQLTMAGLEVDALTSVAGAFHQVIVAEVVSTKPHPKADRLTLCVVDTGHDTPIQVVCGAANVRAGLKVALALVGATLPCGLIIKESMLRGELSQGMLCSISELGMDDHSEGILELPLDAPVGCDLRQYLQLDDLVFDIDLTPNRADCFSILGIARDVSALNQLPLTVLPQKAILPVIEDVLKVSVLADDACPQYYGRIIRGINTDVSTPFWMKERLRRSGMRSQHPVVDILNYVMHELGQPMHAFDLQTLQGNLRVRLAEKDEKLTLLDGQTVTLDNTILVIADEISSLAIAGVMGSKASSVQTHTTDIFIESAFFNPKSIAGTARRYGLSSEAAQRFERGVDPKLQQLAIERVTDLLLSIVGGMPGPIITCQHPQHLPVAIDIAFHPAKVQQLTGIDITFDTMITILQALGMHVDSRSEVWQIRVPSYRFDIRLDVDLVEEIIRIYGYDQLSGTSIASSMQAGHIHPHEQIARDVSSFLSTRGYFEAINYSFVDPLFQQAMYPDAHALVLLNPISSELSQMRISLWPGLLASLIHNMHRQQTTLKLFEVGVIFKMKDDGCVSEIPCVAGMMTGVQGSLNWTLPTQAFDFFDMKGDLQALLQHLHSLSVRFVATEHTALHPGQSARILIDDKEAGWIGVLHPRLAQELDMTQDVMLFELSLPALIDNQAIHYQKISKYPSIRRDLSLLVNLDITAEEIELLVRRVVNPQLLKAFDIFDVYEGASIAAGKKSLAIALTLQDDTRTLVDAEINSLITAILKSLHDDLGIVLRDIGSLVSE
jgi:phenylalanyl-tRNA synthetase beta chain